MTDGGNGCHVSSLPSAQFVFSSPISELIPVLGPITGVHGYRITFLIAGVTVAVFTQDSRKPACWYSFMAPGVCRVHESRRTRPGVGAFDSIRMVGADTRRVMLGVGAPARPGLTPHRVFENKTDLSPAKLI